MSTVTITYQGPHEQLVQALADHGFPAVPEPGQTYALPQDVADALVASSAFWTADAPAKKRGGKKTSPTAEQVEQPETESEGAEPDADDPVEIPEA